MAILHEAINTTDGCNYGLCHDLHEFKKGIVNLKKKIYNFMPFLNRVQIKMLCIY